MSNIVKMTVNITKEAANALEYLAKNQDTTMTNIVNQAIALEKYMRDEVERGGEIRIVKDGMTKTVLL